MVKQRKPALPQMKVKIRPNADVSGRYSIAPLSGDGETGDLAGTLANYPNNTLSRLIERIKSL